MKIKGSTIQNTNRKVRWRTQDENMRWITTKTNNGPSFQWTKFSVIEFVLIDRKNHSGKRPKLSFGKSSSGRFSFLVARNSITKATKYVTFSFSYRILIFFPFLESLNFTVCKRQYGYFSFIAAIINPKIFRQTTMDWEWWRLCRSFINLTEWWKGVWHVSIWLAISNTREQNIVFFHVCC